MKEPILPTAEETLQIAYDTIKSNQSSEHKDVDPVLLHAIESHTSAHTAELREENTRYRQALESIATRWNKVAEHNEMRTALHLIQQDVFEALKNNEE